MRYNFRPFRMAIIKKIEKKYWQGVEKLELSALLVEM